MTDSALIIHADIALVQQLTPYLRQNKYNVTTAYNGEDGLNKARTSMHDVIISDITLPKRNGFQIIKALRETNDTPILILTGRNHTLLDHILCLELGVNDYITLPCNPHKVVASLRVITRKKIRSAPQKNLFQYADISVDCTKREVNIAQKKIELTNAEFNILEILMKSPGQAFSKEELTEHALARKYTAYDRSIDVHVSNIRNKLNQYTTADINIKTVRGFGYLFEPIE